MTISKKQFDDDIGVVSGSIFGILTRFSDRVFTFRELVNITGFAAIDVSLALINLSGKGLVKGKQVDSDFYYARV